MTWRALAVLAVLAGGCGKPAAVAPAPTDLDGTYEVVSAVVEGKADPNVDAAKGTGTVTIKDGTITTAVPGVKRETAKFTLDPSKTPAQIDFALPSGTKRLGIYEVKESDKGLELTIASDLDSNAPRPKDFKGEGSFPVVLKLLRKKDK